jgi:hypothetical protein
MIQLECHTFTILSTSNPTTASSLPYLLQQSSLFYSSASTIALTYRNQPLLLIISGTPLGEFTLQVSDGEEFVRADLVRQGVGFGLAVTRDRLRRVGYCGVEGMGRAGSLRRVSVDSSLAAYNPAHFKNCVTT